MGGLASVFGCVVLVVAASCSLLVEEQPPPGPDAAVPRVVSIAGDFNTTCAVYDNSELYCWGANDQGEIGNGETSAEPVEPTAVLDADGEPLSSVVEAAVGENHGCARLADGTMACWGFNGAGQLGDGTSDAHLVAEVVPGLFEVASIAVQGPHTCAVLKDGALLCWGRNDAGELGTGSQTDSDTPVTVVDSSDVPVTDAVTIGSGRYHTCAIRGGGDAVCFGWNASHQCGSIAGEFVTRAEPVLFGDDPATPFTGALDIAAGNRHTCALHEDGDIWCWGSNDSGQLGIGSVESCTPADDKSPGDCTLNPPQRVDRSSVPSCVPVQIDVGLQHGCARCDDGDVVCWGEGNRGRLGNNSGNDEPAPVLVEELADAVELIVGQNHACARTGAGEIRCWGVNEQGQLGIPAIGDARAPRAVENLPY